MATSSNPMTELQTGFVMKKMQQNGLTATWKAILKFVDIVEDSWRFSMHALTRWMVIREWCFTLDFSLQAARNSDIFCTFQDLVVAPLRVAALVEELVAGQRAQLLGQPQTEYSSWDSRCWPGSGSTNPEFFVSSKSSLRLLESVRFYFLFTSLWVYLFDLFLVKQLCQDFFYFRYLWISRLEWGPKSRQLFITGQYETIFSVRSEQIQLLIIDEATVFLSAAILEECSCRHE